MVWSGETQTQRTIKRSDLEDKTSDIPLTVVADDVQCTLTRSPAQ